MNLRLIQLRPLLAAVLLAAFVGQGFSALAIPCAEMAGAAAMQADADAHHAHHGESAGTGAEAGSRCCDGGFCSLQHCAHALAIPAHGLPTGDPGSILAPPARTPALPCAHPLTLFKPPIPA